MEPAPQLDDRLASVIVATMEPRTAEPVARRVSKNMRELRFRRATHPLLGTRELAVMGAVLLANLVSAQAVSAQARYVATIWQIEQGLPSNWIYNMAQDHQGYLWLGTNEGLVRFDGMEFKLFSADDIAGLASGQILSLYSSRSGVLWLGTGNSGLVGLNNGVSTAYTERDGLPARNIRSIREDADGSLWINTLNGIGRISGGKLAPCTSYRGRPVREFLLQARDRSIWFRSGPDVVRFGADGSTASFSGAFLVQETRDGSIWLAVPDEDRLTRYYQGRFTQVALPRSRERQWTGARPVQSLDRIDDPKSGVLSMTIDTDGELLLLTPDGLVRVVDGTPGPVESLSPPAGAGDLPRVLSLLVDREGNRWVGTRGSGLFRFRRAPLKVYGEEDGLPNPSSVHAVYQDRDGRIWVAGNPLSWFEGKRFRVLPGLPEIWAIEQTKDGDLWFGGTGGLWRFRSGVLTRFPIQDRMVTQIHQDREGELWIIQETEQRTRRLYRFREARLELADPDVLNVLEDRNGGLWLANQLRLGLQYVRGGKKVVYDERQGLPAHIVTGMSQDSSGTLWVSTSGGPLCRFRDGKFQPIRSRELTGHQVSRADGKGNLWLMNERGIYRVGISDLNDFGDGKISSIFLVSYGRPEGMKSTTLAGFGVCLTHGGELWFPNSRGIVAIDPAAGNPVPPPVVLEEASANQLSIGRDGRASIPPGHNTLDFRFTALSLSAPEKQRFQYRLEPYEKDWVDAGTRRTAHYTNMAPGPYSFRVIAANSFGVWNRGGAAIHFTLQPHYYQTNWFRALVCAMFLAATWGVYRLRLYQIAREFNAKLDGRVDERMRVARELHDTLLQTTQAALIQMQAAYNMFSRRPEKALETLQQAIANSSIAIDEGRAAIQGMRSSTIAKNDLARALREAGDQMAAAGAATFDVRVQGSSRDLHPILRDDVYRIAVEALRNAFKHAEAKAIEAEIVYGDTLRVRIRDDGKGTAPAILNEGRSCHYGIPGMRERAERIGGKLDVSTVLGAGTEIQLSIPGKIAFGKQGAGSLFRRFRRKSKRAAAAQS